MRVWDINPKNLCREHLLGQHREIHAIWNIITQNKKGYSKHPETLRWKNNTMRLFTIHELTTKEMLNRGFNHNSPLPTAFATCSQEPLKFINTVEEQKQILKSKGCDCEV